jgi:hypothetical protein
MRVGVEEGELRVARPGALDHLLREVDSYAVCRLEVGEEAPVATAEFKDAQIGRDVEAIDLGKSAVIPTAHALPRVAFAGDRVPVGDAGLLVGLTSGVENRIYLQHGHDFTGNMRIR